MLRKSQMDQAVCVVCGALLKVKSWTNTPQWWKLSTLVLMLKAKISSTFLNNADFLGKY